MAENDFNWNLYKTPSDKILRQRKEFYGLWRRADDQTTKWLNRIQCQFNRCDFPPLISREYLLIDQFMCELNDDEKAFIGTVKSWTLAELIENFLHRKQVNNRPMNASSESTNHYSEVQSSPPPLPIAVTSESVSKFKSLTAFLNLLLFSVFSVFYIPD